MLETVIKVKEEHDKPNSKYIGLAQGLNYEKVDNDLVKVLICFYFQSSDTLTI